MIDYKNTDYVLPLSFPNNTLITTIFAILISNHFVFGQVENDNIENRKIIYPDQPTIISNTMESTVQWQCINKKITGKCITYHNDQWFEFRSGDSTSYYFNIRNQECRDILGVQFVLIEGTPCQPATYTSLVCISLATQDDFSIKIDGLKQHHSYLINIDGYLHDFCHFEIDVSTKPPEYAMDSIPNKIITERDKGAGWINLKWQIDDTLASEIQYFWIYRRHYTEKKSSVYFKIPLDKNTFGKARLKYSQVDSVEKSGLYHYKLVGIRQNESKILLDQFSSNLRAKVASDKAENYLKFDINYPLNTQLTVAIYNLESAELLKTYDLVIKETLSQESIFVKPFKDHGIHYFVVKVTDQITKQTKNYLFYR